MVMGSRQEQSHSSLLPLHNTGLSPLVSLCGDELIPQLLDGSTLLVTASPLLLPASFALSLPNDGASPPFVLQVR